MIFSLEILNIFTIIGFVHVKFWSYSWLAYISKANQQEQSFIFGKHLFDVSNLSSCKYASTFLNEANTNILIAKTEC